MDHHGLVQHWTTMAHDYRPLPDLKFVFCPSSNCCLLNLFFCFPGLLPPVTFKCSSLLLLPVTLKSSYLSILSFQLLSAHISVFNLCVFYLVIFVSLSCFQYVTYFYIYCTKLDDDTTQPETGQDYNYIKRQTNKHMRLFVCLFIIPLHFLFPPACYLL